MGVHVMYRRACVCTCVSVWVHVHVRVYVWARVCGCACLHPHTLSEVLLVNASLAVTMYLGCGS